jgi:hypothetical protein
MTEIERATNLIQRMTRLFAGATPGPFITTDGGIYGPLTGHCDHCSYRPMVCETVSKPDASLIVALRNVGLEGIVGPIRRILMRPCRLCFGIGCSCKNPLGNFDLETLSTWCERWEPELDREEGRK